MGFISNQFSERSIKKNDIRMFYKNQILTQNKNKKQMDMITEIDHSVSFSPVKRLQPTILQGPTKEHLESLGLFYHPYENTTSIFESEQIIQEDQDHKDEQSSHDSDNLLNQNKNIQLAAMVSSENVNSQGQEKRKRKNKAETKLLISENHKDQGRGGNCIASNITKTLLRIVQSRLSSKVHDEFKSLIDSYKIKSQKENTIILLLLLFVFSSQGKIHSDQFQQVFSQFSKSLLQSKNNCEKKMQEEAQRRGFHLKNKKMYVKFIQLNTDLYKKLSMQLQHNSSSEFSLKMIQEMISDTYDRKQREIEKAMNKIKSIIPNHKELIQLFNYNSNQVEEAFQQSIDYAYRRNLPKRCKSVKTSIRNFCAEFERHINVKSDQDKYFMCFLSLILIDQKKKEIWEEFIKNITMKKKFNMNENQLKQLQQYLKSELSNILDRFEADQKNDISIQAENKCKIEEEEQTTKIQQNFVTLFKVFVDLRTRLQN